MLELYQQKNLAADVIYLLYADDYAMAADNQEDLQDRIEHWNEILTSYDMRISKDKTETMIISRTTDNINTVYL